MPATPVGSPSRWFDQIEVAAFIDSYFSFNANLPKPQAGKNRFRAFDHNNGFALSWAGLDLSYQREKVGGTLELRFGPTAERFAREADAGLGLQFVKQAFATWRVTPGISLDFGKFMTIYGAEAPESQLNFNYTRGLLNSLGQPFHHTGLRANFDISDQFWITGLLVNGWDNTIDDNMGKTLGIQFSTAVPNAVNSDAAPLFDAHLGYLVGPEQADVGVFRNFCDVEGETLNPRALACDTTVPETVNASGDSNSDRPVDAGDANTSGLRHFVDLVIGVNPVDTVSLLFNFDYGFENVRTGPLELSYDDVSQDQAVFAGFSGQSFWGLSAMGRVQFNPQWAGALRGEVFSDPDGRATNDGDLYVFAQPDVMLYSATLTVEVVPEPGYLLRLDNRVDVSNEELFPAQVRTYEAAQFTSTLGVVVSTN